MHTGQRPKTALVARATTQRGSRSTTGTPRWESSARPLKPLSALVRTTPTTPRQPGPSTSRSVSPLLHVAERTREMMYKAASIVPPPAGPLLAPQICAHGTLSEYSSREHPRATGQRCVVCGHQPPPRACSSSISMPAANHDGGDTRAKLFGEEPHALQDQGMRDRVQALERELARERRKREKLQDVCDRQHDELQAAHQDAGMIKLADQRKDIMHFFKHAVKNSFSESSRQGFRALESTCQLTVDSMQAFHVKAPVRRINAKDLKSRVPRPRFWGNPQVDHYDLQRLRSAIVEIGLDPSKSPEFPRTDKEVADADSNAAFAKFRLDTETFWKHATELRCKVQQIPIEASRDEAMRAFEEMVGGKVAKSESCIVYSIQCEFASKLQEISFWCPRKKETLILPRGSGLPSAVLEAKCSIAVADLHNHKMYSRELESALGYPRQSALLSPCFNELGQMAFILEVASAAKIVHYTIHDKMLLEFAGALLMLLISRTRLAEEYHKAVEIRNHVVQSVTVLADAGFIRTINQIADRCRECVKGKISRVWLVDRKNQILYVNTDDETKAEMAPMTHASGPLGAAVHDQTSSVSFTPAYSDEDPLSFACVPIVDRRSTTLGVLELNQKYNPTTGLIERFREEDCDMMRAFAAILANFIEHSQFVFNVQSTCGGMHQKIRSWQAFSE